ncbi:MAG: hypothetical protein N2Z40_00495 [Caldimicrobium sp.]|nr:hypothetical protein [Caldimicrobium sp.]MCX7612690.1 hypothetical protein [Caldimicrobium sp.]MDW8182450.1 hypothetical protein [Caldimicrobium sp.]
MEGIDPKVLQKLKEKVQRELSQRERETLEYWLTEIQRVYQKQHRTLEELKSDLRTYIDKMKNRLEILKTKGY